MLTGTKNARKKQRKKMKVWKRAEYGKRVRKRCVYGRYEIQGEGRNKWIMVIKWKKVVDGGKGKR